MAVLTVDEFLLLRKAVDKRYCRNEVGVDTLVESAATYRLNSRRLGCGAWRDSSTATSIPSCR